MRSRWVRWYSAIFVTMLATAAEAAILPVTADGLVLIVNKQQPEGRKLAEKYAELRHVPANRVIEINVPDDVELLPEAFEQSIADVVRAEIETRGLRDSTQCLVTFYGVPLRVKDRATTPFEQNEVKAIIDPSVNALRAQLKKSVEATEAIAKEIDPGFTFDVTQVNTEQLRLRGVAAEKAAAAVLATRDQATREAIGQRLKAAKSFLTQMPAMPAAPTTPKPTTMPSQEDVNQWFAKPEDPEARRQIRELLYFGGNVFTMLTVVEGQQRALAGGEGEASVDSELSCLWIGKYPRQKWIANPWHWGSAPQVVAQLRPRTVRVARIDGPTPEIARRVFEEAVAIEQRGLGGDAVLDARGMTGNGQPGSYDAADQSIRDTAKYLTNDSGLNPIFDNNAGLLPDHSSEHAAIYCGWYSVRAYKPTVKLVPGSIAWHIASYEMVTLRHPMETGWCKGLMIDGADVTLGPVGEPYLIAFPPAAEFLGLLMTGKTNIAEAYWATVPITSWKMVLVGDPLYRPFAKRPAIEAKQLPPAVVKALED
jgi:uncharacterized protein (TIGR03790 family)